MVPQPIYEILPYLYALAGLIAIITLETTLGKVSAAILMVVGVFIHQIRARYRKEEKQQRRLM